MVRKLNTAELINRQGGELREGNKGFVTTNTQPNFRAPDQGSGQDQLEDRKVPSVSGVKFDAATGFFARKGIPQSVARTYGAALLETSRVTGRDITDLVKVTTADRNMFADTTLAYINTTRSKTSQIGYRIDNPTDTNRNIVA